MTHDVVNVKEGKFSENTKYSGVKDEARNNLDCVSSLQYMCISMCVFLCVYLCVSVCVSLSLCVMGLRTSTYSTRYNTCSQ